MEPRPFRRGNPSSPSKKRVEPQLRWSHVPSDVETREHLAGGRVSIVLQWSHVPSDVETEYRRLHHAETCASMEPRPFRRGNHAD